MGLQDKLDEFKKNIIATVPPELIALSERAVEDLRHSGIMERVAKVGDAAPHFTLPNARGEMVSSAQLLEQGPLVITFYRGVW